MKIQTKTRLMLALILCLPISMGAQKILDPEINPNLYRTEIIHPDMGLSSPLPTCIYEDRYGYIWIGTQYGLDLYDGYRITRMNHVMADHTSASLEWVWSIDEDAAGNLWVCSSKGLFRFDRRHHSFEMFLPNLADPGSEDNTVYSIRQDAKGFYWLFTKGGLFSFDREANLFKDYKKDSILTGQMISVRAVVYWWNQTRYCEDHSGTIWIGTSHGLKKYDRTNDQFITFRHDPDDPESISGDRIWCITEDKTGTLWISVQDPPDQGAELNKMMDAENGVFSHYYPDRKDAKSLLTRSIWPLYIDHDTNLWIGGNWGFSRYDYETDHFDNYKILSYKVPGPLSGSDHNYIVRITGDSNGNLWMLTALKGILSYHPETGRTAHYYYDPDDPINIVPDYFTNTMLEDRSGRIWISGSDRITKSETLFKPFYVTGNKMLGIDPEVDVRVMSLYDQ
jgi:ligand-binding sensor domain-containing protein